MRMVEECFLQKLLRYDTTVGRTSRPLSCGIAQGSLEGPDCWVLFMNGLLRLALPEGIILVGYVNGTAAIIVAPDLNTAQIKTEVMMRRVACWMGENGVQLTFAQTEGYRHETLSHEQWGNERHETDVR